MSEIVKWSYSSINTLRQCNRRYYYANILATHGRKDPLRRKAYELKAMQTLQMWRGSVVDKFLELVLIPAITSKGVLDFAQLSDQAVEMAKAQFRYSKNKGYTDPQQKKGHDFCVLNIHEIGTPYQESDIEECYGMIKAAIVNFPSICMPDGERLLDYLYRCNGLTPNVNNYVVEIGNARLMPQIDLVAICDWKPVVMDWKLSASYTSDFSRQLIICGLTIYLRRLQKADKAPYQYSDIKLYEVNLFKGTVKEHIFSKDAVTDLYDRIALTTRDIQLLKDGIAGEAEIENYEITDDEGLCSTCNFQTLCSYLFTNKNQYDEKSYLEFVQHSEFS